MKLLIRQRALLLHAERTRAQTLLLIGGVVLLVGLVVFSFFDNHVQLIEVLWVAVSAYGLVFDILNLLTATEDRHNSQLKAAGLRRSVDEFTFIYLNEKFTAAQKRVVALSSMFIIGVVAMFQRPPVEPPDSVVSSIVLLVLFLVMGYCVASNAQDAWLSRRLLREQQRNHRVD